LCHNPSQVLIRMREQPKVGGAGALPPSTEDEGAMVNVSGEGRGQTRPVIFSAPVHRMALVGLASLYVLLLRWSYVGFIVPRFGYIGYSYSPPSAWLEVFLVGLALVPAGLLSLGLRRPSQFVLWFLYTVVLIPSIMMPLYNRNLPATELVLLAITLLGCFLVLMVVPRARRLAIPALRIPESIFWAGALGTVLAVLLTVRAVFGFPLTIPSLSEVYARRAAFMETAQLRGSLAVYLSLWLANVVNPLLLARSLVERRLVWGIIALLGQIALFSISGFKSVLMAPVLVVLVWLALRGGGRRFGNWVLLSTVATLAVGLATAGLNGLNLILGLLVRRVLVTPGWLTGAYFEYFSHHPKVWLARSLFRGWTEDFYRQGPSVTIGDVLAPGGSINANANFWADGFANFGLLGVIGFTLLLALFLWIYDSASVGKNTVVAVVLVVMPTFALTNTALLTTLATHGLGVSAVIVLLLPNTVGRARQSRAA
jgi:hypothetical protein